MRRFGTRSGSATRPCLVVALAWVVPALLPPAVEAAVRRVDIGGWKLRLSCSGEAGPTVLFEAGLGETLETWNWVRPTVAGFTRACAYDRAGLGRSEPGPLPRTASRIVEELHVLLDKADIRPPYVLVGHSFGGLLVRLYAARWPKEVTGLVLVEATHEDYPAREKELRAPEHQKLETALALATEAARSEFDSLEESVREVRQAPALPDIRLIVISAPHRGGSQALGRAWEEMQAGLARLTSRGRRLVAEESGHYVQFDEPELVVGSIREIVSALREEARPKSAQSGATPSPSP